MTLRALRQNSDRLKEFLAQRRKGPQSSKEDRSVKEGDRERR